MGIQFLTSFMLTKHAKNKYYVPYKLQNQYVIIDGSAYVSLYLKSNDDPRFGGDCKKMYDITYQYFKRFIECKCTPIVVLGGLPSKRVQKSETSQELALTDFKVYNFGNFKLKDRTKASIIFRASAFYEALDDLNIFYCRGEFDKDREMVELGKKLGCPIISYNSEFFIHHDIIYLPWDLIRLTQKTELDYIECSKFNKESLLKEFDITYLHLPYLAILFESDHCKKDLFKLIIPENKGNKPEEKMRAALKWLQYETVESARKKVLRSAGKRKLMEEEISEIFDIYTKSCTTLAGVLEKRFSFKDVDFEVQSQDLVEKHNIPLDVMELARTCKLPLTILEMLTDHSYSCRISLENIMLPSVCAPSIPLIQGIYGLLLRNAEGNPPPLKILIREVSEIVTLKKDPLPISNCFLTLKNKKSILLQILEIDSHVYDSVLKFFHEGWVPFALALIYFKRECKNNVNEIYVHSIVLAALLLHIMDFYEKEGEVDDGKDTMKNTLDDHFKNLQKEDCKEVVRNAMTFNIRKSDRVKLTSITSIHMYMTFQACLIYIKHIFRLLKLPYEMKVSKFISGSFFYSISKEMKESARNQEDWIKGCLDNNDQLWELYSTILSNCDEKRD